MDVLNKLENSTTKALALTIGNFDGVHRGHQAIFDRLVQTSQEKDLLPAAITFSPHAKIYFTGCDNYLLCDDHDKQKQIEKQHIKVLYQIPFNKELAGVDPNDFLNTLRCQLNIKYLLIGDDFNFGHKGQGNYSLIKEYGKLYQIEVEQSPTILSKALRISSSRIRQAIRQDDFKLASDLLGRPVSYSGIVIKGKQLGRKLGFPTANLSFSPQLLLPDGVFAVRVFINDEKMAHLGMCNIGIRPTVDSINETNRLMEVHLFDVTRNLYHQTLRIEIVGKIRSTIKFSNLEQLTQQLSHDKQAAIAVLSQHQ